MKQWIGDYIKAQKAALDSIPPGAVEELIEMLRRALAEERQVFVFGNGGSATNASHFATDLGKGASDKLSRRFRVLSLNDNVGWMTALANDYAYEEVFAGQLQNYARPGDVALASERERQFAQLREGARVGAARTVCAPSPWSAPSAAGWPRLPSRSS